MIRLLNTSDGGYAVLGASKFTLYLLSKFVSLSSLPTRLRLNILSVSTAIIQSCFNQLLTIASILSLACYRCSVIVLQTRLKHCLSITSNLQSGTSILSPMTQKKRFIFHLDMDHFYTAVEERENPTLKGAPVVVGADPKEGKGRGVVSTSNYQARASGVRSGMPISQAYRLCPNAVYLPPNFPLYIKVSSEIMAIARKYAESLSSGASTKHFWMYPKSQRLGGSGGVGAANQAGNRGKRAPYRLNRCGTQQARRQSSQRFPETRRLNRRERGRRPEIP